MPDHEVEQKGNDFGIEGILLYVRLVFGAMDSGIIGYVVPMLKIQVSSPIQRIAITHGLITLQIPFGSALVDLLFTGYSTSATNSENHSQFYDQFLRSLPFLSLFIPPNSTRIRHKKLHSA